MTMRKVLGVLLLCVAVDVHAATPCQQCPDAKENPLPLPSYALPVNSTIKQESLAAYEKQIFDFLDSAQYEKLGWCVDKGIRDTGRSSTQNRTERTRPCASTTPLASCSG